MEENLQLTQEQFDKLRQKELELLTVFMDVCRQLNLRYFVVEGTLLGAVRHRGFIPWDDDVDVGMLREDYEQFVEKAAPLLPDGFFLQTHQTDPQYAQCYAKLRNNNTAFVETTAKDLNIHHGIYLDIFPFDYYPDNILRGLYLDGVKLLVRYRVREIYYIPSDSQLSVRNLIRRMIAFIAKRRFVTVEDALAFQEKVFKRCQPSRRYINNGSPWKNRERVDASVFADTQHLTFEGLTVCAPGGYERYLRHVYGDYMQLPPESERIPHHHLTYISFDKAYRVDYDSENNK